MSADKVDPYINRHFIDEVDTRLKELEEEFAFLEEKVRIIERQLMGASADALTKEWDDEY